MTSTVTYGIGEVAGYCNVSLRTIRFYEQKGLLKPQRRGTRRVFGEADRDAARFVVDMASFGFTLAEIKPFIGKGKSPELGTAIKRRKQEMGMEIEQLRASHLALATFARRFG